MWECAEQWKPPSSSLLVPGLTHEALGQFQSSLIYIMIFALYQAGGKDGAMEENHAMDGCAEERPHLSLVFP